MERREKSILVIGVARFIDAQAVSEGPKTSIIDIIARNPMRTKNPSVSPL